MTRNSYTRRNDEIEERSRRGAGHSRAERDAARGWTAKNQKARLFKRAFKEKAPGQCADGRRTLSRAQSSGTQATQSSKKATFWQGCKSNCYKRLRSPRAENSPFSTIRLVRGHSCDEVPKL